jgi:hypothetical protein
LASLTKPLFIPALMRLRQTSAQEWCEPRPWLRERSLLELLDHASGARPWFWMGRGGWVHRDDSPKLPSPGHFEGASRAQTRTHASDILTHLAMGCLDAGPRGEQAYSDVNAFLLARAWEHLHGDDWNAALSSLCERTGAAFHHASLDDPARRPRVVPYYPYVSVDEDAASGGGFQIFGPAHDTNANLLADKLGGVVSGHAGLLGSVADVDTSLPVLAHGHDAMTRTLAAGGEPSYATQRTPSGALARFRLGLDTPSGIDSTAGLRNFPPTAPGSILGHLGYTGTSFWFCQREGVIAQRHILLTNRVAQRTRYGSELPRVLVVTHARSGHWVTGAQRGGGGARCGEDTPWRFASEDDIRATVRSCARSCSILWDPGTLRTPPDLTALRRSYGRLAWDT